MNYIARTVPKNLLAERGKLGSCSARPLAVFFCQIHLQIATGQVVMLHADTDFLQQKHQIRANLFQMYLKYPLPIVVETFVGFLGFS